MLVTSSCRTNQASVNGASDKNIASEVKEVVSSKTMLELLKLHPDKVFLITSCIVELLTNGHRNDDLMKETFKKFQTTLEEVVNPKRWDILEISCPVKFTNLEKEDVCIFTVRENGLYSLATFSGPGHIKLEEFLSNELAHILKIRREDGFTLKIGDRIQYNNSKSHLYNKVQKIKGFHIGSTGSICMDTNLTNSNGLSVLQDISKVGPLFIAADGIPIYEGQSYYVCMATGPKYTKIVEYPGVGNHVAYKSEVVRARIFSNLVNARNRYIAVNSKFYLDQLKTDLTEAGIHLHMDIELR